MKILHVLSGDFLTGAETSTALLIEYQLKRGHRVFVIAGHFTPQTKATVCSVPIFKRNWIQRLKNVYQVVKFIKNEKIDIVHAHSRAASWVCFWATQLTQVAYLSSIHGRQHIHYSFSNFNVYGTNCIAVCENIKDQLLKFTKYYKKEHVFVIRNGIKI